MKQKYLMRNPTSLEALRLLISTVTKLIDVPKITMVEIGSYSGESSQVFVEEVKFLYCIDPWRNGYDSEDEASEIQPMAEIEQIFDTRMKPYENYMKLKDTSVMASTTFDDESLDFVYIDGNHNIEAISNDIISWLPKIKPNGVIGGHDYNINPINKRAGYVKSVTNAFFNKPPLALFPDHSWIYLLEKTK